MPATTDTATVNARTRRSGDEIQNGCGLADGGIGHERAGQPVGQRDTGDAAARRQHPRFDEQLAEKPPASGPERQPERELLTPRRRSREHQGRDVRAGNQQDDRGNAEEDEERLGELLAELR